MQACRHRVHTPLACQLVWYIQTHITYHNQQLLILFTSTCSLMGHSRQHLEPYFAQAEYHWEQHVQSEAGRGQHAASNLNWFPTLHLPPHTQSSTWKRTPPHPHPHTQYQDTSMTTARMHAHHQALTLLHTNLHVYVQTSPMISPHDLRGTHPAHSCLSGCRISNTRVHSPQSPTP